MRRVHKARLVPDTAPDSMTEKVIRVEDLGVPIAVALGDFGALTSPELHDLENAVFLEMEAREDERS